MLINSRNTPSFKNYVPSADRDHDKQLKITRPKRQGTYGNGKHCLQPLNARWPHAQQEREIPEEKSCIIGRSISISTLQIITAVHKIIVQVRSTTATPLKSVCTSPEKESKNIRVKLQMRPHPPNGFLGIYSRVEQ